MAQEVVRVRVPYDSIVIGPEFNTRKELGDIDGLAKSIDNNELIQPLMVREGGPATDGDRKYFLVAGERRYRAIGLLRKKNASKYALIEVKLTKANAQGIKARNAIENLQRKDLEPLEQGQAIRAYMDEFKATQKQVAEDFGLSEPFVSQRLSLVKSTSAAVQTAVQKGEISATHARELMVLPAKQQDEVLGTVKERQAKGEKVSVADVRDEAIRLRPKKPAGRKTRKSAEYDADKIAAAREVYEKVDMRPKAAALEMAGRLIQRLERSSTPESKAIVKAQIAAVEWFMGVRDQL